MITAIAIRGASAGAKPMNQECDVPSPISAVPVLPATLMPGMAALAAYPLSTPSTMKSRSVLAVSPEAAIEKNWSGSCTWREALPRLSERGLIAVDNTLWSGTVLDDRDRSEDTEAIRAFNEHVRADPRVVCVLLTVRDGLTVVRKA